MTDETSAGTSGEAETGWTITIQGLDFDVGAPYAAGHVVNENEANALNQTRAENIRNNFASRIKKEVERLKVADSTQLDLDAPTGENGDQPSLNAQFAAYVGDGEGAYQFGVRPASSREPVDPVQKEALVLARQILSDAMKAKGILRKNMTDEQYENALQLYAKEASIQKEAKRRVADRQKIGAGVLEQLGLGGTPAPQEEAQEEG